MPTRADAELIEWPEGDTAARVLGASEHDYGLLASLMLRTLSIPYRAAVWLNNRAFDTGLRRARQADLPVISIGNIVAGGAGKTPFTRWLVQQFAARGQRVAILHGGYGSDEPDLHRKWQPAAIVIEQKDRVQAASAAAEQGADIIVLDDAFQHRRIARSVDVVLMPVELRSMLLLPAGPLREPESALARADLIVVTRKSAPAEQAFALAARLRRAYQKPIAVAAILPAGFKHENALGSPPQDSVLAVASIARPDLLLQQLRAGGLSVARMLAYPDHHEYTARNRDHIRSTAAGRPIVTTEKDAIKLLAFLEPGELWILEQQVVIEAGEDVIHEMIRRIV